MPTAPHSPPRTARPLRDSAPALPPLEALDRTHQEMLALLEQLEALPDQLESEGESTAVCNSARRISDFFAQVAQRHHQDEEVLVFPALLASGDDALVRQVHRLQQDHGWLEEDWLELAPQLGALASGYGGVDPALLRHVAGVFVTLYREHIALEESMIYPAARRLQLSEAAAVAQRLTAAAPSSS